MNLSHKVRIYPNKQQTQELNKACGVARFTWNYILGEWDRQYKAGEKPAEFKLRKQWNSYKEHLFPWVYESPKDCNQKPIMDLGKAFDRFFKKQAKYPKFKKKGLKESFYISNDQAILTEDSKIRLPLIGVVKLSEKPRFSGKIMSFVVSKDVDQWFVSITYELPEPSVKVQNNEVIGVDLGLTSFIILSDGTKIENPKFYKKLEKRIKQAQRRLAKKKKGGENRKKAQTVLGRLFRTQRRKSQDFIHKITSFLAKTKQEIVIEYLNVSGMMKNNKLARSVGNVGFSEFRRQLEYKTKRYGSLLTVVDTFFPSSKLCSTCGFKNKDLQLSDRSWVCPQCNTKHDRDLNAALNLKSQAKSVGKAIPEFKPAENSLPGKQTSVSRYDSMKQEKLILEHSCSLNLLQYKMYGAKKRGCVKKIAGIPKTEMFPKDSGFISPAGEFLSHDDTSHQKFAMNLIKNNPEYKKEYESYDKDRDEPAVDFLLDKGFIRVGSSIYPQHLSFTGRNLYDIKNVLKNNYLGEYGLGYRGRIIVDVNGSFYDGSIVDFLSGEGRLSNVLASVSGMTVYHGTNENTFPPKVLDREDRWGLHFGNLKSAKDKGSVLFKCKLNIKNPYQIEDLNDWVPQEVAQKVLPRDMWRKVKDLYTPEERFKFIESFLEKNGFDAISYVNKHEYKGSVSYMIWDLKQIVSSEKVSDTSYKSHLQYLANKTADFGGLFQNVQDVRPDPGNVNPGKNNEIVKQQTDFYPHKTSDADNGEFVHTHPDHCPRPDLRKLKIVDPDESESEFSKAE